MKDQNTAKLKHIFRTLQSRSARLAELRHAEGHLFLYVLLPNLVLKRHTGFLRTTITSAEISLQSVSIQEY